MNKKYTIVNADFDNTQLNLSYFLYILILFLGIYLIFQIIFASLYQNENFDNVNTTNSQAMSQAISQPIAQANAIKITAQAPLMVNPNILTENKTEMESTLNESKPLTMEQQLQEAKIQNNLLKTYKENLEEVMKKQIRSLYLANNYYKVDDSSLNNEIMFINDDFMDIRLPASDFNGKILIKTPKEWNDLIAKTKTYKNFYKVGDVVLNPSEYNISKDNICYKDHLKHLNSDPNFKKKYPECMVCSVNPEQDYTKTKSYANTKTNIHKVCLFNPSAPDNSNILNYNGCKKLCRI
jgi:hypothetical protein